MTQQATDLRARVEARLPPALLARLAQVRQQAAEDRLAAYLAGGLVRDVLGGRAAVAATDLDIVVVPRQAGDSAAAPRLARALARAHGGDVTVHSPFGTATWHTPEGAALDFATARTETYAMPGALPTVAPTNDIALDLRRRDFTINAMALRVDGGHFGELVDPYAGQRDLDAGLVRALHANSFRDDPTRVFRAVRYEQRLDLRIADETAAQVPAALTVLAVLSGERLRHELALVFREARPTRSLERLAALDVLGAVHPALSWSTAESADAQIIGELPRPAWQWPAPLDVDSLYLTLLLRRAGLAQAAPALARLGVSRAVHAAVTGALGLELSGHRPSEVVAQLEPLALSAVAAAYTARPEAREPLEAYLSRWRHIRTKMTGDDLLALGLAPGPEFRRILGRLRAARLDGEIDEAGELALARELAGLE